jgi:hypothetical protein
MGLRLRGVSQSSKVVALSAASSLRAGITNLLHRADLAPAVLIVAFISFLAHVLVGQLAIGLRIRMAAPDPAKRRRRARSRRRRRLPFHTKGVGLVFHPSTVCSNQSISC